MLYYSVMSNSCQQCGSEFKIPDADQRFFKRAAPRFGSKIVDMPLPTFCPDCRNQRRSMFRNDRSFYKRKCDLTGKQFISLYPQDSPYTVYHHDEWYSDKWNPMDYGRDFDFSRSFFEQFKELMLEVPRLGIDIVNCENSSYCNYCGDDKNCYLDIAGEANEDSYFNLFVKYSKNVVDCTFVYNSTLCYECINCYDCYTCQNFEYCENCSDLYFCYDLKGCRNCIFCSGLRDKEYFIFNEKKTKEEYEDYLKKLALGSFKQRRKLHEGWTKFKLDNVIFRANYFLNCENCIGNNIKNSKNTFYSFNALNCEDCAYLYDVLDAKDCLDLNYSLYKPEVSYELISTLSMVRSAFSMASHYNHDVYYCDLTNNSGHLFGCIALNHGEYCVLNKQYSKEEYEQLVPKIIEKMQADGEWGEFFPAELSPFAYNETVADEYFSLNKNEIEKNGWRYVEKKSEYSGDATLTEIPDDISDVEENICKEILKCEKSGKLYKIIPQELKFYKKMGIPVPRCAPDQRHKDRIELRTPRRLWDRKCMKCDADVKTAYSTERKEKVYCDRCYLKEVR